MSIFIQIDDDQPLPLRPSNDGSLLVVGRYVCGGDDVFDLPITVKQLKEAETVTLIVGDTRIELREPS